MRSNRRQETLNRVRAAIKGRGVDVPARARGKDLREALDIPENRMLVVRPGDGGNVRKITPTEIVDVRPEDEFDDVPVGRWGGSR